jgi:16S rRNA (cytosine967-C5)-methyltransferase
VLELADVELLAVDRDRARVPRIAANLERLGLAAQVRVADAAAPDLWWDGAPFDRVLLDVPCSASGVVRRHPDIKWLRRSADLAGFARSQSRLLEALWRVLAADGKLLYATCSVFPEENGAVIDAFLARHDDARRLPLPGLGDGQLLPDGEHDGFFYALLEKR